MNIGNIISLGSIDKDPLQWTVPDIRRNKALLISYTAVDKRIYHERPGKPIREKCSLRRYLNNFFLIYAFSDAERRCTARANLLNFPNSEFGIPGGYKLTLFIPPFSSIIHDKINSDNQISIRFMMTSISLIGRMQKHVLQS